MTTPPDTVTVPREATEEMIVAGEQALLDAWRAEEGMHYAWKAMVAAAPPQPEPGWQEEYVPTLINYQIANYREYVTEDTPTVVERIDDRFSIVRRMSDREIVGFQYGAPPKDTKP